MLFKFQRISREEVLELFILFSRRQQQRIRREEVSVETNSKEQQLRPKTEPGSLYLSFFFFIPMFKDQKKETNIEERKKKY